MIELMILLSDLRLCFMNHKSGSRSHDCVFHETFVISVQRIGGREGGIQDTTCVAHGHLPKTGPSIIDIGYIYRYI